MNTNHKKAYSELEARVAEKYRQQGYQVITNPGLEELPFDLGTYRPDLVVKKSPSGGHIIELKGSIASAPIDRLREISEIVSQHPGWNFLLVTGDDISRNSQEIEDSELLTWDQIAQRRTQIERLINIGEDEGAFLSLWRLLEALLRRVAEETQIPIDRLPTLPLIKNLYSQGELSMEQYNKILSLSPIRNNLVHGLQTQILKEPLSGLRDLIDELLGTSHEASSSHMA